MSSDGAMVPLVGGEWAEVKTMVIGEVEPGKEPGEEVKTGKLSYFARLDFSADVWSVGRGGDRADSSQKNDAHPGILVIMTLFQLANGNSETQKLYS